MHNRIYILLAFASLSSCDKGSPSWDREPTVPHEFRDTGSQVMPTNDASQRLISLSGPDRFASFVQILAMHNERCDTVSKAILTGGLDGNDTWRVRCQDGREWTVWFYADGDMDLTKCDKRNCV